MTAESPHVTHTPGLLRRCAPDRAKSGAAAAPRDDGRSAAAEPPRRVLLAVFAHPDDESFGPGGTLARVAAEGGEVHLVCATDGAAGDVDAGLLAGRASAAEVRAAELGCAARKLGLAGVHWLGYRDSGMPGSPANDHPDSLLRAPPDKVTGELAALIRGLQPQVVICDNQFGGYGHPDHVKLHAATMQALAAAGDPACCPAAGPPFRPACVYHPTFSTGALRLLVRVMPLLGRDPRRTGRNRDIDMTAALAYATPVHVCLDTRRYVNVKLAAAACHRSQSGPPLAFFDWLPRPLVRRLLGSERFTQAWPPPAAGARLRRDLFDESEAP